ncbi:hypothetical protein HYR54_03110 [Candidatus Acetothermia bacterium]|nr:hypothetical protein [Candidatus Acetothermia bacterium]
MDALTKAGPYDDKKLFVKTVVSITLAVPALGKDITDPQRLESVGGAFFQNLDSALKAYRGDQYFGQGYINEPDKLWAVWTFDFLTALSSAQFISESQNTDKYANMVAGFVAYVNLGMAGWRIGSAPAESWYSRDNNGSLNSPPLFSLDNPFVRESVHFIAYKVDANGNPTFIGIFHIEAFLNNSEINPDQGWLKDILYLAAYQNSDLETLVRDANGLNQLNLTYSEIIQKSAIFLVIFSSDAGAPQKLHDVLETKNCGYPGCQEKDHVNNFKVPVYAVYIGSDGTVGGYCVGPCPTDAAALQARLNEMALLQFGVPVGGKVTPSPHAEWYLKGTSPDRDECYGATCVQS